MASKGKNGAGDILFGYMGTPSWGWRGKSYGGFSAAVYADGRIIHKTYFWGCIVDTETERMVSKDTVAAITGLLEEHQAEIDAFDERLDNDLLLDGGIDYFIFNGKKISSFDIYFGFTERERLKENNPSYYEQYRPVLDQEYKILSIFFAAAKILKSDGVNLDLDGVSFCESDP